MRDYTKSFATYPQPRDGETYSVATNGQSILCWVCHRASHNYEDVNLKYCGYCQKFHKQKPTGG